VLCCAVLCCAVPFCAALCRAVLLADMLRCTVTTIEFSLSNSNALA